MATQQNQVGNGGDGNVATTRRRASRNRAKRRTTTGAAIRSGAATGGNSGGVNLSGLTARERDLYVKGFQHACDLHNIPWQGGMTR